MFNADYLFQLEEGSTIQSIGGDITGHNIFAQSYSTSEYVDEDTEELVPTFVIRGGDASCEVDQDVVKAIYELDTDPVRLKSIWCSNCETESTPESADVEYNAVEQVSYYVCPECHNHVYPVER